MQLPSERQTEAKRQLKMAVSSYLHMIVHQSTERFVGRSYDRHKRWSNPAMASFPTAVEIDDREMEFGERLAKKHGVKTPW